MEGEGDHIEYDPAGVATVAVVFAVQGVHVMLQVTRHTSHVTRHTSHVTRHTSHVTRHTSHVTRHTSHVTRHTCSTVRLQSCLRSIITHDGGSLNSRITRHNPQNLNADPQGFQHPNFTEPQTPNKISKLQTTRPLTSRSRCSKERRTAAAALLARGDGFKGERNWKQRETKLKTIG